MEVAQSTNNSKIKISVKDSKYATGRRKTSIAKIWLKKVVVKFQSTVKIIKNILKEQTIKCNY